MKKLVMLMIVVLFIVSQAMATDFALVTTYRMDTTIAGNVELMQLSDAGAITYYGRYNTTGLTGVRGSNPAVNPATGKTQMVTVSRTGSTWYADTWEFNSGLTSLTKIGTSTLAQPGGGYPSQNGDFVVSQIAYGQMDSDLGMEMILSSQWTWHGVWGADTGTSKAIWQQGHGIMQIAEPWNLNVNGKTDYSMISMGGSPGAVMHWRYTGGANPEGGTGAISFVSSRDIGNLPQMIGDGYNAKDIDGDGIVEFLALGWPSTISVGEVDDIDNNYDITGSFSGNAYGPQTASNILIDDAGLAITFTSTQPWGGGTNRVVSRGYDPGTGAFIASPYGEFFAGGDVADIAALIVPEPATLALLGMGCLFAVSRRRK